MGAFAALLTAFYMTRQVFYVFAGASRLTQENTDASHADPHADAASHHHGSGAIHESPAVMTVPLALLSVFALLLGFFGTPAWPWFQSFLDDSPLAVHFGAFCEGGILPVMLISSLIVFLGLGLGWYFYGRKPIVSAEAPDAVGKLSPCHFSRCWAMRSISTLLRRDLHSPEYACSPRSPIGSTAGSGTARSRRSLPSYLDSLIWITS